ncbi:MAG: hypothetical protein CMN10_06980 [Roseobacter sp.]|nr:hypothetical protein [Roseobacter sp.]MBV48290.1 hypothetical protein [Roseobacter sp.]|tara:strand:- start:20523 stop:20702 length:180 start_codon:yes stop_codon:yes gene_type:complete
MESRQVRRATARHEAKVRAAEDAGRKYPESRYEPFTATGKSYPRSSAREAERHARSNAK